MLPATMNPRSGSRLRLPALLAVAHASLALYLWVCAPDVNLVIVPVRLWEVLTWLWVGWPALLVVLDGRLAWSLVNGEHDRPILPKWHCLKFLMLLGKG